MGPQRFVTLTSCKLIGAIEIFLLTYLLTYLTDLFNNVMRDTEVVPDEWHRAGHKANALVLIVVTTGG